jgi:hypothetical protein
VSFKNFEAALRDVDAAMALTTDTVRLCDALRLRRASLLGLERDTADVEQRLTHCPS